MLRIVRIKSCGDRHEWMQKLLQGQISGVQADGHTLLLSDLPKKFDLQRRVFAQGKGVEDESMLRVHEFWLYLHRRLMPDHQIISRDFLRATVRKFLNSAAMSEAGVHAESEDHVLEWIDFAHPLFLHPDKNEVLKALAEDPRYLEILRWWKIADAFFQGMLAKNWVASHWTSALVNQFGAGDLENVWSRPLIVDLGSQVSQNEIDILEKMSQYMDVFILIPDPSFSSQFPQLMKAYEDLMHRHPNALQPAVPQYEADSSAVLAERFSGPLAEVKSTAAKVRQWLNEGIEPHRIALLSPQIEEYWPILRAHLQVEGIPAQKSVVSRMSTLLPVHQWLSRLRLFRNQIEFADLESALAENSWEFRSEKFQALFRHIMDRSDLSRWDLVAEKLKSIRVSSDDISVEEFLAITLMQWQSADSENLMKGLHRWLESTPMDAKMSFDEWLTYLDRTFSLLEVAVEDGVDSGIVVGNLSFGDGMDLTHRIYLGLQDSVFQKDRVAISGAMDVLKFASQIGFQLKHPEELELDFDLQWQLTLPCKSTVLLCSDFGWEGQVEMPHAVIVGRTKHGEALSPSQVCRWDEIQYSFDLSSSPLITDKNQSVAVTRKLEKFSATAIEKFIRCPFLYTAEKDFRLQDEEELDIDAGARTMGSLAHRLFERLGEKWDFSISNLDEAQTHEFLEKIVDEVCLDWKSTGDSKWDEAFWPILREKLVVLAGRFIRFETEQRAQFSQWKIYSREAVVSANFNLETRDWEPATDKSELGPHHVRFQGFVDRIDFDGKDKFIVLDYKTKPKSFFAQTKWMPEGRIQLGIYASVIDSLKEEFPGDVWGAIYYTYKPFRKDLGFLVKEGAGHLYSKERPKDFSLEKWKEYSQQIKNKVAETLERMMKGEYRPQPLDPDDCDVCRWRGMCRSSHLS